MAHLIDYDRGRLHDVQERLQSAHRETVAVARRLARLQSELPERAWGTSAKRVHLGVGGQPLTELQNQAATVERLLDALEWVSSRRGPTSEVSVNPTTSSVDADLVVFGEPEWRFEVSDVAGPRNTNRKLDKDLATLAAIADDHPACVLFLVTSTEWGTWLSAASSALWTNRGFGPPPPSAVHTGIGACATCVIEVNPQRPSGGPSLPKVFS